MTSGPDEPDASGSEPGSGPKLGFTVQESLLARFSEGRARYQSRTVTTYRVGQVAELLGVSTDTVRRWADGGGFGSRRRAGGQRLIDGADLARFLTETRARRRPSSAVIESARNRFPGIVTQGREGRPRRGGAHPGRARTGSCR